MLNQPYSLVYMGIIRYNDTIMTDTEFRNDNLSFHEKGGTPVDPYGPRFIDSEGNPAPAPLETMSKIPDKQENRAESPNLGGDYERILRQKLNKFLGKRIVEPWNNSRLHARWNNPEEPHQQRKDITRLSVSLLGIAGLGYVGKEVYNAYQMTLGNPSWTQGVSNDIGHAVLNVRNIPGFTFGMWKVWERAKSRDEIAKREGKSFSERINEVGPMSLESLWDIVLYTTAGRIALETLWPSKADYLAHPANSFYEFINEVLTETGKLIYGGVERVENIFITKDSNPTYRVDNVNLSPILDLLLRTVGVGTITYIRDRLQHISDSSISKVTIYVVNPIESIINPKSSIVNLIRDVIVIAAPQITQRRNK